MGVSEASESLKLLKEPHGESGQVTFVSSCNQPPGVNAHAGRLFLAKFRPETTGRFFITTRRFFIWSACR
jgi:hypothetical protein